MKVLVINCGSSSLKYQLIDMSTEESLAQGLVERIGIEGSVLTQKVEGRDKYIVKQPMADHKDAIKLVLDALVDSENGVISSMDEISAVGHRVVHGGEKYNASVVIDSEVKAYIEECFKLAPLHNPANMIGINACEELMPNTPMVAVFDTAFHGTMPEEAYIYALPYELYQKHGIRKYGFHGTSHKYVSQKVAEVMGKDIKDLKIITCHLGNGASLCAVKNGVSVDTSMGFTPLEGLAMGTRSGSIDPAIVTFLMKEEGLTADEVTDLLNKKSGLFQNKGENQIKEIINASKLSVFFIDEAQKVTLNDIGSVEEIKKYANILGAKVHEDTLTAQFRCNGSDGYLNWLNDVLEINETANFDGFDFDYDLQVVDNPAEMRKMIEEKNKVNNKSRLLAGYCWKWESKKDINKYDIVFPEYDFKMKWNLNDKEPWAIGKDSVNEIGCIHTCQGLEFDYVGVIIGNDIRYENGRIITDFTKRDSGDKSIKGIKKLYKENKEEALAKADEIIKNTYRVLLTRGMKGCYIYCRDEALQNYLKERSNMISRNISYKDIEVEYKINA